MKKKVGIVGCGTIGSALAGVIRGEFSGRAEVTAVCDVVEERARRLGVPLSMDALVDAVDLVVEAASPGAARMLVPKVMEKGKEVFVMSVGGLLESGMHKGVYFPSGAIAGLDGIKAVSRGRIDKLSLTTYKSPGSLGDKQYAEDTVVFEGGVKEAVAAFPKNINVCAALALVSGRPDIVTVKIVASPSMKCNTHTVCAEGDFGRMTFRMENMPSPGNPKTSYLAVLSAVSRLRDILYG